MDNVNVQFKNDETIKTNVQDINYIPSYKKAELERQKNERERIAYYNEIQQKVANGEFNGRDGKDGEKGEAGERGEQGEAGKDGLNGKDGYTPVRGTDFWTAEDIKAMELHCDNYIDSKLGTINEQLASLTEVE